MRIVFAVALWLGAAGVSSAAMAESAALSPGAPLAAALEALRAEGLEILYSSAIVTSKMRVLADLPQHDALGRARALLAPHGLQLLPLGSAQYVVVRGAVEAPRVVLRGRVVDAASRVPLPGARIAIEPGDLVAVADGTGRFATPPLTPGRRTIAASLPTFAVQRVDVDVGAGVEIEIGLRREPLGLGDIVVATSRYRITGPGLGQASISGHDIEARPLLADDALRSTAQLPGVAASDVSAPPHLRGGGQDQTLVLLDGYPLRSAYHLPGFGSPVGVIDPALVDVMDVYPGAFPARFGGRMSGVIDIHTPGAPASREYLLGVDVFNAVVRAAGPIGATDEFQGSGLVRVGTLGAVLGAVSPETASPQTADGYARFQWQPSPGRAASIQALSSTDELAISEGDGASRADLSTRFDAVWARTTVPLRASHTLDAWFGFSRLATARHGEVAAPLIGSGSLDERKTARYWDARIRWTWKPNDERSFDGGVEAVDAHAQYDVRSNVQYSPLVIQSFGAGPGPLLSSFGAARRSTAAYASGQWRLADSWRADVGVRFERVSRDPAPPESAWEPRMAVRWQLNPRLVARLAWGVHGQPQDVVEIAASDGMRSILAAQRAEHWVAGAEVTLPYSHILRVEYFKKRERRPQPRYENLFDGRALVPELAPGRVRVAPDAAELEGVELSIGGTSGRLQWWANYTYAQAYDELAYESVARAWDQRHAAAAGLRWHGERWTLAAATSMHSGRPTTSLIRRADGALDVGTRNSARLGRFASIDLRATYAWPLPRGVLETLLQVTNATNRRNQCCSELSATGPPEPSSLAVSARYSLPLLPAVGLRWIF